MKRIVIALAAIFVFSLNCSYAQSNETITYGIGYMAIADVAFSPNYYAKDFDPNQRNYNGMQFSDGSEYSRSTSLSLFTFKFLLNTKLYTFNNNASISLNTAPNVRFAVSDMGCLTLSVPITVNYNRGVLSTFDSDKENGFHVGLGAVIQTTPLLTNMVLTGGGSSHDYGTHVYLEPCIQLGYRYWGINKKVGELCLQVGYMDFKDLTTYTTNSANYYVPSGTLKNTSFSANLTFIQYLNY